MGQNDIDTLVQRAVFLRNRIPGFTPHQNNVFFLWGMCLTGELSEMLKITGQVPGKSPPLPYAGLAVNGYDNVDWYHVFAFRLHGYGKLNKRFMFIIQQLDVFGCDVFKWFLGNDNRWQRL